jgi:predicted AlkP superfamily phosphohydrolase/phosphomutase
VVEGVGWRLHLDPRVAALLPEVLSDVERVHAEAALALLAEQTPSFFAYVITLTDRIQHPFWRLHDPSVFGADSIPHPGLENRNPVEEAYRLADEVLGKLLAALPEDTLVFVLSDHGAAPLVEKNEGTHRMQGIWIAAGPGVVHDPQPHEYSILDIMPTLLQCVGAPLADDMPGRASDSICRADETAPDRIASYTARAVHQGDSDAPSEIQIDASREEQLRSLGYIE